MSEGNDNTLTLPSWEEGKTLQEQAALQYDLTKNWLDYTLSYPEPRFLLEYGGVPFSPLGGIQAISGHQKNGKTFLMCQFMAAILNGGNTERMRSYLPNLKIHEPTMESLSQEPTVLYIDTEMEKLNTVKVVRRVQWLCEWNFDEHNTRLNVLWLRAEESNAIRWGKTKQAIIETRPTAIFLDGIRDVIGDFNDNKESSSLISECMKIATDMDCCIWAVLHENPNTDKMRGHLGTELGNKVTDTFVSIKKKENDKVTFTVKQQDARGKDVPDWQYEIVDDAGSLGVPRIITPEQTLTISKKETSLSDDEWATIVKAMKEIINPPRSVSFTTLREGLKRILHIANAKAGSYIEKAKKENIIIDQRGKLIFNNQEGNAAIELPWDGEQEPEF